MYRSKKFIHYLDGYCNKPELTLEDCTRLTSNINRQFNRKYGPPPDVYLSFDANLVSLIKYLQEEYQKNPDQLPMPKEVIEQFLLDNQDLIAKM